ncbi:MAG TPA: ECF transporter S component, partial [Bacilli bacterium]
MKNKEIIKITETAILSALAVVLQLISTVVPILKMPQGGSLSLSMLPIVVLALRRGIKYGVIGGLILGLLNMAVDTALGTFSLHWGSLFLDYLVACGLLGIAGIFQKKREKTVYLILAIALSGFLKYLSHSFSGVLFFAEYAKELGYETPAWIFFYSFIYYNLPYMG